MSQPLRLLLVDDNPQDRALVARELSREFPSVDIVEAIDQESLERLIGSNTFDLVITDYHLHWSDGIRVLEVAKAHQSNCPVIMFTGTGTEQVAVDAMKLGLDDYIVKAPKHFVRLRASARSAVERAEAMDRFKTLESSLSSLLSRLKVGVFLCDLEGNVRSANDAFSRILLLAAPTNTVTYSFRNFFCDTSVFDRRMRQVAVNANPVEFEAELRTSVGDTVWADVQFTCITDHTGATVIEGLVTDITARKLAAEALQRQQEELAHMGRLTTMGELAAGLAHEVNQPLGAIANYAGACLPALEKAEFPGAENTRQWLVQISEQALRAGNIIRSISRFLHRNEPSHVRLPLRQVIDESLELINSEAQRTETSVACQVADVEVEVDRVLIQQLFVNLIRNAIEAMQENSADNRIVEIKAIERDDAVAIEVRDHGPGITEELLTTLFKPFMTSKSDGLGMGLAVCTRIVESHRGRLTVASSSDGATFHFTLPMDA